MTKYEIQYTEPHCSIDHKPHYSILFDSGVNIFGGSTWDRAISRSFSTREEAEKVLKLFKKRDTLHKRLGTILQEIDDEDCSLTVFEGELSERDKTLKARHEEAKTILIGQKESVQEKIDTLTNILKEIENRR